MTVTSSPFTIVFRVGFGDDSQSYSSVRLAGFLPHLGTGNIEDAPEMEFDHDSSCWLYALHMKQAPSSLRYRFTGISILGRAVSDIERHFVVPDHVSRLLNSSVSSKVLIELKTVFSNSESRVSIYTPGVPVVLSPPPDEQLCRMLVDLKEDIVSLKLENEKLRKSMIPTLPVVDESQAIRELLCEINELKGKVVVLCRIRPLVCGETEEFGYAADSGLVCIDHRDFEFDKVLLPTCTNSDLFESANLRNLIQSSLLIENNLCVFAYGQTGSGKSHSMMGTPGEPGLVQLCVEEIFSNQAHTSMSISMIEIYRETVFPLVANQCVYTAEAALELVRCGLAQRATAGTRINATSSRSHCVCTVQIGACQLYLVDLAGSERTKKSGAFGDRLAEANAINKSLSSLGLVLNGLLNRRKFIPYRDSKLTTVLAPVFTREIPASKVVMIANVSPYWEDQQESVSTLQFAQRVGNLEMNHTHRNEQLLQEKLHTLDKLTSVHSG